MKSTKERLSKDQIMVLQALSIALKLATNICNEEGSVLDVLQAECSDPDSINDVCDTVDEYLRNHGPSYR